MVAQVSTMSAEMAAEEAAAQIERRPIDLDRVPETVRGMLSRLDAVAVTGTAGAALDIMARILEAETEEEIFEAANAGTKSGQSVAGRPFLVGGFDWKRSAPAFVQQGAFPFYALVEATMLDTGERTMLDCGGFTFVAVLDKLDRGGYLAKYPEGYPLTLESRQMASGFHVLIPHPYKPPAAGKPGK